MSVASIMYPAAFMGTGITLRRLSRNRVLSVGVGSNRPIRGIPEDVGRRKRGVLGLVSGRSNACSLVIRGINSWVPREMDGSGFRDRILSTSALILTSFCSSDYVPYGELSPMLFRLRGRCRNGLGVTGVGIGFSSRLTSRCRMRTTPALIFFGGNRRGRELENTIGGSRVVRIARGLVGRWSL